MVAGDWKAEAGGGSRVTREGRGVGEGRRGRGKGKANVRRR